MGFLAKFLAKVLHHPEDDVLGLQVGGDQVPPTPKAGLAPLPVLDRPATLADLVTDVVTGFHGIVIQYGKHLHGCNRLTVEPVKLKEDGSPGKPYTFDIQRLTVHRANAVPMEIAPVDHLAFECGDIVKDNVNQVQGVLAAIEIGIGGDVFLAIDSGRVVDNKPLDMWFAHAGRVSLVTPAKPPVAEGARSLQAPGGPVEEGRVVQAYMR